jgi:predicted phage terminase large subunit-like protein
MSNSSSWKNYERLLARAQSRGLDPELDAAIAERRGLNQIREDCLSLPGFVRNAWPLLEPDKPLLWGWALDAMADHLAAVTNGDILRLLINVPPGMMKSMMTGVFWPAWEWGPLGRSDLRILSASYKEDYAVRDTRKMRELVTSPWYQRLWGKQVNIVRGGEGDFANDRGGWRKGSSMGSLTGERGDRVVLDDPHSTETADSERDRERTARILRESVPTRLNSPKRSAIVVIMQRLHDRDVSGIILAEELGYEHLCLPMRFEPARRCRTGMGFIDPRKTEGELLFPERWDAETLDRTERAMTAYAVAGQHQQRPVPREGGLFKHDWFEIVDYHPRGTLEARAWDLAAAVPSSKNGDPDYTVGLKAVRLEDRSILITHMVRFRKSPGARDAAILELAAIDGWSCVIRLPQDPAQAGKSQAEHFARMLDGYSLSIKPVSGEKALRATPAAMMAELGRIKLLRGPWNAAFLEEITAFPSGAHDDVVDALSDLVDELGSRYVYTLDNVC